MLVKMKCPQCGASMEIDDRQEQVFCSYCGTKVANLKERYEITQNVNMSGTVQHNMSGTVRHIMDRSNEPNLYIYYASVDPTVMMVVRIATTGTKNTYIGGQTQTYHLPTGKHTIVLKIGRKNYDRTIIIPEDNSPVRINAAWTGRRAEITIDQPTAVTYSENTRMNSVTEQQKAVVKDTRKQSPLGIIAFVLSFLFFGAFLGVPLAVLDLVLSKKDQNHKHGLAIAALVIGTLMCYVTIRTLPSRSRSSCTSSSAASTPYTITEVEQPLYTHRTSTPKPTTIEKATATPASETKTPDLSAILNLIQDEIETLNKSMTNESNDLITSACSDYSAYKANKQKIQDFYVTINTEYCKLYSTTENACIEYYKKMLDECDMNNYEEWDSAIDDLYNTWDSGFEGMYTCWDSILTDLYDGFDGVISDAYSTNYTEASTEWQEMYRSYSETWATMYRTYSNNWSLLYHEYSGVWSSFYRGDTDVDKAILKAKGELQEKEPEEGSPVATESPKTPEPTAESVATGIRPEFQKLMDEYLAFFEEYCEFIKEYNASPSVDKLLEYMEIMEEYDKTIEALDELDTSALTPQENALYVETMLKIEKMLLALH